MRRNLIGHVTWLLRDRTPMKRTYDWMRERPDGISPGFAPCIGCSAELSLRLTTKTLGPDIILGIPPGCMAGSAGFGRETGMRVTTFTPLLNNSAAVATGLQRALLKRGEKTKVVIFAGDGATADIGLQALSAAAERREPILYICYDNEGYMNTGVQRSSTTPAAAQTATTPVSTAKRGKSGEPKDVPLVLIASKASYVATATPAFPADLVQKIRRAAQTEGGLAYVHIFSPCPVGWRFPPEKTIEVARLAVETLLFVLWEAVEGRIRLTRAVLRPRPLSNYLDVVGKYNHLSAGEKALLQEGIDRRWRRIKKLLG